MKRRGQAWGLDLTVASIIFLIGLTTFFIYSTNYNYSDQQRIKDLTEKGDSISNYLLSSGEPENWNISNVIKIGLTTNGKINQTKLESFHNLSTDNYNLTKSLLNIRYDYFINASSKLNINGEDIFGIGREPTSNKDIIKISRVTVYNNEPITLYVEIW